jgi:malonate decarboxylase epsilon subunit
MTLAFLCPGQGAQTPGFLHRLPDHPVVRDTLAEAERSLGREVLALDGADSLTSTVAVQLSTVIAGVAAARLLAAQDIRPDAVAGLSVGAFTAAIVAGALTLADGLPLVRRRAQLMEAAYPAGYGLAAIVGLGQRRVAALIADAFDPQRPVYLANLNAPTQFVVAGAVGGLEAVLATARAAGARKAERMTVAVPSHCPLLADVANALSRAIATVPIAVPQALYVDNGRARPTRDPEAIRADLAGNVMAPVRWHDGTALLVELGVRLFIELPPGEVLTGLAQDLAEDVRALALDNCRMDSLVTLAARERQADAQR